MSIRMAASCGQPWQVSAVPRGARTGLGPAGAEPGGEAAVIGDSSSSRRRAARGEATAGYRSIIAAAPAKITRGHGSAEPPALATVADTSIATDL
jgi:hypothetical protein